MSDSTQDRSVDTTIDPRTETKGLGADTAQTPAERDEAVREFDDHAVDDGPRTLDESEERADTGTPLSAPDPRDVTDDDRDPKQTSRTE